MSGVEPATRRTVLKGGLIGSGLLATPAFGQSPTPRVGGYEGIRQAGVHAFLGIRYATAERFARPVRLPFASDPTPAREFGPICPQRGNLDEPASEDCLFLNVWTPDLNPAANKPVMVYFHGGAYNGGTVTDPVTHGQHLAGQGDVVVVSVNQRLNVFGYPWLAPFDGRYADSGNLGQLDLIAALEWVRDHAAKFGGDPSRVMVFGQSGGGAKIATLMAMPAAKGLFHSAATMSGQQVTASGPTNALKRITAFFEQVGVPVGNVDGLKALSTEQMVAGLDAADPVLGGSLYFGPVLDMVNLPRHPFWPDAAPQSLNIPMILGNTTDETRAFINPEGPVLQGIDWSNIAERIRPNIKIDLRPDYVVQQYREHFPDWSPERVFYAATTDGRSWPGQYIEADERAKAGAEQTWVYQLDRESPIDPKRGAAHTDDLPYVFGTLDAPGSYSGTGSRARQISAAMMKAFTGLAHTGTPGLTDWAPYTLPDRATLMVAEDRIAMENDPRGWQREMWSTAPYIQPGI
ncbi:carboxylesterase/lipase family protein [Croceicoccus marinus]|uniref:Carboxylic ester hydrolase n=1 Tax=Croceicoccus marinus TaxID=450378 RepID=A0A7G6VZZ3_9SPHN|nr:carboxylesterase family protein [Croceicoccus marinus]QNE07308.1 carboxylesterase/lipase family protein [Croceicoccus marinus]